MCLADSDYYESESNTARDHAESDVHYRNLLFVFPINTLAHTSRTYIVLYAVHNTFWVHIPGYTTWSIYVTAFIVRAICVGPAVGVVDREMFSSSLSRRKRGHLNCSATCADDDYNIARSTHIVNTRVIHHNNINNVFGFWLQRGCI